ncbi:MAG TPA: hypothetical protein VGO31_11845 [Microbacteriaceae bacterium]|nr:hypothetical protein [Microbacteriaceae bacterium]
MTGERRASEAARVITEEGLQERVGAELVNLPPVAGVVLSMWLDEYHWWEIAAEIGATEVDARNIYELTCAALREAMVT